MESGKESLALQGGIAVDGEGNTKAPAIAEHLLDLGYAIFLLLDSDEPPPADAIARVKNKGGVVIEWPDECSTEERVFLDLPWDSVVSLVRLAEEFAGSISVKDSINNACVEQRSAPLPNLVLPASADSIALRRAIGIAAKSKGWFKDIERGELLARIVYACFAKIPKTPLGTAISFVRKWIDG